jgi:hypothetical protein
MFYMVGGSSKKNQQEGERWLNEHPEARYTTAILFSKLQY